MQKKNQNAPRPSEHPPVMGGEMCCNSSGVHSHGNKDSLAKVSSGGAGIFVLR